jgi:hypothetical protein
MNHQERSAMAAAILSLIAAVAAGLITRSVMISNHRQAWINGLREDLAAFFTAIDVIHFKLAVLFRDGQTGKLEEQQKARNDVLLAYRKILMRLNINEPLHQQLEKSLASLLMVQGQTVNQEELTTAVTLARTILKHEWEVTKYGVLTTAVARLKAWWRRRRAILG